jgi:hypothetical protein
MGSAIAASKFVVGLRYTVPVAVSMVSMSCGLLHATFFRRP